MVRLLLVVALVACGSKKSQDIPPAPANPKAATFWTWFQAHAAELATDKDSVHLMNTIGVEVELAAPGVIAEIGVDKPDGHTLVLSADDDRGKFPAVQALYAARPAQLPPGWKVQAFRPRDGGFTIEMGAVKIAPKDCKVIAEPHEGKLDLQVFLPSFTDTDAEKQAAFIVLDHTIGEYDMETKIGVIDFLAIAKAPPEAKPLSELPALVDALK